MKLVDPVVQFSDELQKIRRDLHAHPELRYEEHRTSDLVASKLQEWNIEVLRGLGETGVVGILRNGDSKKAIGLRADMDALPMQETNHFPHASQYEGKMHACGHDGHTTMLLGAAYALSKLRDQLNGTVYFVFQPAEEGGAGAERMILDGLFEKCPMDAMYGIHNWPGLPAGFLGTRVGPLMASSNTFWVKVKGKGGHAAQPHMSIDPVTVASHIVIGWQNIASREMNPVDSGVISVTQIHTGTAMNIIPDFADLNGTVRTYTVEVLDLIESRMREIAENIAKAFNCTIEFEFERKYPPLINHKEQVEFAGEVMREMFGEGNYDLATEASMTAEDFAFFLLEKPGCYMFLGNGDGGHRHDGHGMGPCNLHNGSYDFNDELLPIGGSFWVNLVTKYLK